MAQNLIYNEGDLDDLNAVSYKEEVSGLISYYKAYVDLWDASKVYCIGAATTGYGNTPLLVQAVYGTMLGDPYLAEYLRTSSSSITATTINNVIAKIIKNPSVCLTSYIFGSDLTVGAFLLYFQYPDAFPTSPRSFDYINDYRSTTYSGTFLPTMYDAMTRQTVEDSTFTYWFTTSEFNVIRNYLIDASDGPLALACVLAGGGSVTTAGRLNPSTSSIDIDTLTVLFLHALYNYRDYFASCTEGSNGLSYAATDIAYLAQNYTRQIGTYTSSPDEDGTTIDVEGMVTNLTLNTDDITTDSGQTIAASFKDFDLTAATLPISDADSDVGFLIYECYKTVSAWKSSATTYGTLSAYLGSTIDYTDTSSYNGFDFEDEEPSKTMDLTDLFGVTVYFNYVSNYILGEISDLTQYDSGSSSWITESIRAYFKANGVSSNINLASGSSVSFYSVTPPTVQLTNPVLWANSALISCPFTVGTWSFPSMLPSNYYTKLCNLLVYRFGTNSYLSGKTLMTSLMSIVDYYHSVYDDTVSTLKKEEELDPTDDDDDSMSTMTKIGIILLIIALIVIIGFIIYFAYKQSN